MNQSLGTPQRPPSQPRLLLWVLLVLLVHLCGHAVYGYANLPVHVGRPEQHDRVVVRKGRSIDYYKVLRVRPSSTPDMIKRAYRLRAKAVHPDTLRSSSADQGGHEEFLLVKEAYRVLSDPELKATYDRRRTIGLGFGIAEILAVELVVPVAKDVAIPLVREAVDGINTVVVKRVAQPFVRKAVAKVSTPIRETVARLRQKRREVTQPIMETFTYLGEKRRQVQESVEHATKQVSEPLMETVEEATAFVEKSAAFLDETTKHVTGPLRSTAEFIDNTTRQAITEPIAASVAYIEQTYIEEVAMPFAETVELSAAFIEEQKRMLTRPMISSLEASAAFLEGVRTGMLNKATELKQIEASRRSEQIRRAEMAAKNFLDSMSVLMSFSTGPPRLAETTQPLLLPNRRFRDEEEEEKRRRERLLASEGWDDDDDDDGDEDEEEEA